MPGFLQPDPVLLAFAAIKEWVYLTGLLVFAVIRVPFLRRPALWAGLLGLGLTAIFVAGVALTPILGLSSGPLFLAGGMVGGMVAPLLCSLPLFAAAVMPGRRFWGFDLLHLLWFGGLVGLWVYSVTA